MIVLVLSVALGIAIVGCAHLHGLLQTERNRPRWSSTQPLSTGQIWRRRGGIERLRIRSEYPNDQWRVENVANGKSAVVDGAAIVARWDFEGATDAG